MKKQEWISPQLSIISVSNTFSCDTPGKIGGYTDSDETNCPSATFGGVPTS